MRFIGYKYDEDKIKWKKVIIDGEETKYSISNIGLVRNDKNDKILKTNFSKGYERVGLTINGVQHSFFIHRLVAKAFIPNPENKPEVNHINGNKSCNYDSNLEWCTRSENQIHAAKTGLINANWANKRRITEKQAIQICELLEENKLNQKEIARQVGCSRHSVFNILHKNSYTKISRNYQIDNYTVKQPEDYVVRGEKLPMTKYSEDDVRKVCKLIDKGQYTLREIESKTSIPYQTIRNIFYGTCRKDISKDYNFMKTRKRVNENKAKIVNKICSLIDEGYNSREVAEKLDVPRTTVRNIMSGGSWKEISKNYNFMKNKNKN